jgi:polyhydroxyalkanoate synthesis repressor PhaR
MAVITIKKYSNRKLYDQSRSRYVTLDDIAALVREGSEVRVVDATTGEDLTSVTLAQVILENERAHKTAFPSAFLHQLIKHGEAAQEVFQTYMKASLDAFLTGQQEAGRAFREWAGRAGWMAPGPGPRGPEAEEPTTASASAAAGVPGGPAAAPPQNEGKLGDEQALRAELESLKEKVRQIEQRLSRSG